MTPTERDLEAVERGVLTREVFLARHGSEGAAVLAMHERMLEAASPSAGDPAAAWDAFRERLDAPAPVSQLRRTKPRRTTVLALAATLALGGTALAASQLTTRDVDGGQPASAPAPLDDTRPDGPDEGQRATRPAGHLVPRLPAEDAVSGVGGGPGEPVGVEGEDDQGDDDQGDDGQGDDGQGEDSHGGDGEAEGDTESSPDDEDGEVQQPEGEDQDDTGDGSSDPEAEDADAPEQDGQGSGEEDS